MGFGRISGVEGRGVESSVQRGSPGGYRVKARVSFWIYIIAMARIVQVVFSSHRGR